MAKKKKRIKNCPACRPPGKKTAAIKSTGICSTCKGKKVMSIINARTKGGTFERKVAKKMSKWTGVTLRRTPMSGGWNKTGDITPLEPEDMVSFFFSVELKNNEVWLMSDLLKGVNRKNGIISWWKQCAHDCEGKNKIPLLIFTKNREDEFCMMRSKNFDLLLGDDFEGRKFGYKKFYIFLLKDLLKMKYKKIKKRFKIYDGEF